MIFANVMVNICIFVHVLSLFAENVQTDYASLIKEDKVLSTQHFESNDTGIKNKRGKSDNSSLNFGHFYSVTYQSLDNETHNYSGVQRTDTTTSTIRNESLDTSFIDKNISEVVGMKEIFSSLNRSINSSNNNDKLSTQLLTITENSTGKTSDKNVEHKAKKHKTHNIPYTLLDEKGSVQTFALSRSKMQLQHHLQLAPMEDAPFGTMMAKEKRYLVTVLVPIGVGIIGAALIVCTILTLRKIARQRSLQVPIDDTEVEKSITPSVSSINTEVNDKVFLLFGDEEI